MLPVQFPPQGLSAQQSRDIGRAKDLIAADGIIETGNRP
jgi:hypothetical protein